MKSTMNFLCCLLTTLILATFTSCSSDSDSSGSSKPNIEFYGLNTAGNALVKYNANNSGNAISTTAITGLQPSEILLGIDFRPATGELYGLGSTSRLYTISTFNGMATPVSLTAFPIVLTSASLAGFDFNPTVDRIRVVTSTGINFRLNPDTGVLVATDTNLNPGSPSIAAAAYNNNTALATATSLYVIDSSTGTLYLQNPPNNGVLVSVGSLGITGTITGNGGFDIDAEDGTAIASLTVDGMNHLYQVDLTTGAATDLGMLETSISGLAIPTAPSAFAVDASNNLILFNPNTPGTSKIVAITGLQVSETIVGLDIRPATGQLYGLGSTGRVYILGTAGTATMVGTGPAQALSGTEFGFDFNPLVDRIRVVSNTGQNFRINPNDGTLIGTGDIALSPGTPNISAVAYSNNYVGTTTTVLFYIDAATDTLYSSSNPNGGILSSVGTLGVDVTAGSGFDIGGATDTAYALLTVGGNNGIYTINKTSGSATLLVAFPAGNIKAFAVGLGN
ncbi:DUF4394 domain-containing protein [Flavobacterium sangjuense]|uniref:DUF4394 domain-containing protein n=1 Tax=Flavobacterium sangjuense TaxID=2518177 RepID=A0A4P7PUP4_9FLAO|nr:DUF4394 domain-containing protein [Flavobacterium sangjuense]QBZ98040.1 hypothetical protein GS03_01540 [Flavobacterium sangjuense]